MKIKLNKEEKDLFESFKALDCKATELALVFMSAPVEDEHIAEYKWRRAEQKRDKMLKDIKQIGAFNILQAIQNDIGIGMDVL